MGNKHSSNKAKKLDRGKNQHVTAKNNNNQIEPNISSKPNDENTRSKTEPISKSKSKSKSVAEQQADLQEEEKLRLLELEKLREEQKKRREEEERRKKEEEMRKLELEREEAKKRREQKSISITHTPVGCYKTNKINVNKPIQLNKSQIDRIHIITAEGYLRESITKINIKIAEDIKNEIIYFYAKPLPLKIKLKPSFLSSQELRNYYERNQDVIKCVLFCPIDDTWGNLLSTIRNAFNLHIWSDIKGLTYISDDGTKTSISKTVWNDKSFSANYNVNNIFEMESDAKIHARIKRENSIKMNKRKRKETERRRREYWGSYESDESSSSYTTSTSSSEDVLTLKEMLKNFDKFASVGQLFMKYNTSGTEEVVVKVSFSNKYKPVKLSWGAGDKFIVFEDIHYIAWGVFTPVLDRYKHKLNGKECLSVVGRNKILDITGKDEKTVELWVKGLRKLIGQTDVLADRLAKQGLDNYKMESDEMKENDEMDMDNVYDYKKDNLNRNILIIGGIVVIGIALIVALNRKRLFR